MGRSITITAGYGVYIPGSADEDVDYGSADILNSKLKIIQDFYASYGEIDEEDREDISWYELGEYIEKKYPYITLVPSYIGDYHYGAVLFVKDTVKKEYEGLISLTSDVRTGLLGEEEDQLREVTELFEVDFDPQVWVSVSYW